MAEHGFYADGVYWQTVADVSAETLASYPEGTIEVPLRPVIGEWVLQDGAWIAVQPDLDALRRARIAGLRTACAAAIVGGFTSSALGNPHRYPSAQTDQINLMGSVTASLLPDLPPAWETPFWCADETGDWQFRMHSASAIRTAGADGKAHVVACQARLETLTAAVMTATTETAIAAITWESENGE